MTVSKHSIMIKAFMLSMVFLLFMLQACAFPRTAELDAENFEEHFTLEYNVAAMRVRMNEPYWDLKYSISVSSNDPDAECLECTVRIFDDVYPLNDEGTTEIEIWIDFVKLEKVDVFAHERPDSPWIQEASGVVRQSTRFP